VQWQRMQRDIRDKDEFRWIVRCINLC
jgi:hypothetical protein